MTQTSINIRIDKKLKQDFEKVCNEIGLSMSAAFNVFAKTVAVKKEIPFKLAVDEEWGHLSSDNLLSPAESAGAAGKWDDSLSVVLKNKSAWAEAVIEKEIQRNNRRKENDIT